VICSVHSTGDNTSDITGVFCIARFPSSELTISSFVLQGQIMKAFPFPLSTELTLSASFGVSPGGSVFIGSS